MVYDKFNYISTSDLIKKLQQNEYEVFVFGTSKNSALQASVLQGFQIPIYRFVDNSQKKWGTFYQGVEVVPPEVIKQVKAPLVIIANTFYTAMFRQLADMEIKEVYIISDLAGYDFRRVLEDRKYLEINNRLENKKSNKILLQEWVGLGDIVIQIGVLEEISKCGLECDVITQNPSNYWLLKKIFKNVILVDRQKFYEYSDYRQSILVEICDRHYKYAVGFEWEPSSTLGMLNEYNTNISDFKNFWDYQEWENGMCKDDSYLTMLLNQVTKIFPIPYDKDYDCLGRLEKYLEDENTPSIPDNYICIGFGAKTWMNAYPTESVKKILSELLEMNFNLVLLGAGQSDDIYYEGIIKEFALSKERIVNLSSRLTISETISTINNGCIFIGIDSGLAHVAYTLNKKGVVLISRASKNKYSHNTSRIKYLTCDTDCEFCGLIKCNRSASAENYAECISKSTPEDIIKAVKELI